MMILRGRNRDTRGDSGAGKTNVLLALAYAFGFCPIKASALRCWNATEPMAVEVHLATEEGEAVLTRGDKGLTLTVAGKRYKGGVKAVEAQLDRLCGVEAGLRGVLTYRSQRKTKRFLDLNKTPAERDAAMKAFLVQVLRLEVLEKEWDRAVKALKPLEDEGLVALAYLRAAEGALEAAQKDQALAFTPEPIESLEAAVARSGRLVEELLARLVVAGARRVQLTQEAAQAAEAANAQVDNAVAILEAQKALAEHALVGWTPDRSALLKLGEQADKCKELLRGVEEADRTAQAAYDAETGRMRCRCNVWREAAGHRMAIDERLAVLRLDAEALKADVCQTCKRTWDQAQARYQETLAAIAEEEKLAAFFNITPEEVEELEVQIKARRFQPDTRIERLKAVYARLREQMATEEERARAAGDLKKAEAAQQVAVVQAKIDALAAQRVQPISPEIVENNAEIQRLTTAYGETQLAHSEHKSALALAAQRNAAGLAGLATAEQRRRAAEAQHAEAKAKHAELQRQWKQEADYADMLKGFRAKIFDEVLEAIGQRATAIVGTLPNAAHVSVEFKSERLTGTGTVQDRITPVTYFHGEPRDLEESANGGALTSIELAVDLAVAQTVSDRLGCNLNWIVLDEAFNGHDAITKLACLEMLQAYAADKLVVIVDHNSEFKEMFAQTVTVELENNLSRFAA